MNDELFPRNPVDVILEHVADVLLLNYDGSADASVAEMNFRCQAIIDRECRLLELENIGIPNCLYDDIVDSSEVRDYYLRMITVYKDMMETHAKIRKDNLEMYGKEQ